MSKDVIIVNEHDTRNVRGVTGLSMQEYQDILRALVVSTAKYNGYNVIDFIELSIISLTDLYYKKIDEKRKGESK